MNTKTKMDGVLGAILLLAALACGSAARSPGAADPGVLPDASAQGESAAAPPAPVDAAPDESAAVPPAAPNATWTVRVVAIDIERQPDGERFVSFVQESYDLEPETSLRYSAYFGGMPIEMNHMDGMEWDAGEAGRAVFDAAAAILADPERLAELSPEPDDGPSPPCPGRCYHLGVEDDRGDSTFLLGENGGRAFEILDGAFTALITAFERDTGRPLTPAQLPQK
jgi:hypothetical protein